MTYIGAYILHYADMRTKRIHAYKCIRPIRKAGAPQTKELTKDAVGVLRYDQMQREWGRAEACVMARFNIGVRHKNAIIFHKSFKKFLRKTLSKLNI